MRKISLLLLFVLAFACPATAQMVGYSINTDTGLVTTFSCDEHGDSDCFRNRTALGTIATNFFTGYSAVTTLAPTGELVVGNPAWGDIRLDWLDLPSLDVVSSLTVVGEVVTALDIAFCPDSTLWMTGRRQSSSVCSLYTVDRTTGEAAEVWNDVRDLISIAFVGERMFLMAGTTLLEFDRVTATAREVVDYYWPGPYGGAILYVPSLSSWDSRLWSLSFSPPYPPGPDGYILLGTHDMENGGHDVLVGGFDWATSQGSNWWTLDLVDSPEQQPAAIPSVGRSGLAILVGLIGFVGAFLARRAF